MYLIFHDGIGNIFDKTSKFVCILDIVDKALDLPLVDERLELLESLFQLPSKSSLLDLTLGLGGASLPFQLFPPRSFPRIASRDECTKQGRKGFDPGCQ